VSTEPRRSVSLGLAILSGVFACHRRETPQRMDERRHPAADISQRDTRQQATQRASAPAITQRLERLDESFRAIEDGLRDGPRDRWDPEYVVAQVGKEPRPLFDWVRDHTSWIPYRGVLRGPVGVLMDRHGNSLDRALLVAMLLEKAGHTTRLAHGELSLEEAVALLPALVPGTRSSAAPGILEAPGAALFRVAAEYRLDSTSLDRTLKAQRDAVVGTFKELNSRVTTQVDRLLRVVPKPSGDSDWSARFATAVDALRDHWWVQYQGDSGWVDLDLFEPDSDSAANGVRATETMAAADLPSELHHTLAVRLIIEQWSDGRLQESRVLDQALRPADLIGQTLVLQVWPGEWPKEVHPDPSSRFGLKGVALDQHRWGAVLTSSDSVLGQGVFLDNGELLQPPPNAFSGLGSGIAALGQPPTAADSTGTEKKQLTAAWIEYEIRAPGAAPRTFRRPVFDLLGPARRAAGPPRSLVLDETQRLTRSLALMLRADVLPITCRVAPEFLTQLTAKSTLGNRNLLRTIARSGGSEHLPPADTLLAAAVPPVSPLLSLALARLDWNPYSDRLFVDRVGLVTRHRHPGLGADGFGPRGAIDILGGETGVTLAEPDAFVVRLTQGVLDANAEALWWMGAVPLNVGEAWQISSDWASIRPAEQSRVTGLGLPDDSRFRIMQDLKNGLLVVAPKHPVSLGSEHFAGWWRIDPATGVTVGVSGTTRGQCGPEYGVTMRAVIDRAAESFAYEYVLCQEMAQAFNMYRGAMAEMQRRGYWAWWMPGMEGVADRRWWKGGNEGAADPRDVYKENAGGCLIGAIMGGMLSTASLLPFVIRGAEAEAALAANSEGRAMQRTAPMGPPRGSPPPGSSPGKLGGTSPMGPPVGSRPPGVEPVEPPGSGGGRGSGEAPSSPANAPDLQPEHTGRSNGTVPPGQGPFHMDPENKDWLRENWDRDPGNAHPLANAMGSPVIYDRADQAALSRYVDARARGLNDQAARQESFEGWWKSVRAQRAARKIYNLPGAQWVVEPDGATGPSGSGAAPANPGSTVPLGPPRDAPPPGAAPTGQNAPQNPGNAQPAVPVLGPNLYQIAAGSAGVTSSFYPFPWPD
jgi:hypothetical protein